MRKGIKYLFLLVIMFLRSAIAQDLKPPDKYMLAQAFEQSSNYEKAKEIFAELLTSFPADYNYLTSLNRVYLKLKEYDNSIRIIEKRISEAGSDYNLYGLLGNTYYIRGDVDKAFDVWEKGININPKNVVPYRAICSYAVQNRAYEKAISFYLRGEKEIGRKGMFTGEIFNLYTALNKTKEAVEYLCDVIQYQPENVGIGKSVFYTLSYRSKIGEEYTGLIKKYLGTGIPAYKELLAFIYMLNGESVQAFDLIKDLDSKEKNGNALYNFGMEAFGYRNYGTAALALGHVCDNYQKTPFYLQARIYYPKCLELDLQKNIPAVIKSGSRRDTTDWQAYRKVISAYEETAKLFPHTENWNEALLRIGVIKKEIFGRNDEAAAEFEKIIKANMYTPSRSGAVLNLAGIKTAEGKFSDAENLLNDFLGSPWPDSLSKKNGSYLLGKALFYQGRFNEAADNLDEAASDYSGDISNDAIELSALISACKKDSLSLLDYAKADFLISAGELQKGEDLLKKTAQSGNFFLADASRYRYAELLASSGRYPEAVKLMEEISSLDNSNYADNAYFSLGNIYFYGIKDFRSSKSCFEKLLAAFPQSIFADKAREMIKQITNKEEKNDNRPDK